MAKTTVSKTRMITGVALFTALTVVLQLLGSFIRFGVFSISLVALPIIIGSALYGPKTGAWLGFVFGFTVLVSGDANLFLASNAAGTVITVLGKGIACGFFTGLAYTAFDEMNLKAAGIIASVVCPVVNTGLFVLGCFAFFMPLAAQLGAAAGIDDAGKFVIVGFVGMNFIIELLVDVILCPVIIRLIEIGRKEIEA